MHGPRLSVVVRFFPHDKGGRASAPVANGLYRPHFRVTASGEYLGVAFVSGGELALGAECVATVELAYPETDYTPLSAGAEFSVLEGARIVGTGVVRG